MAGVIRTGRIIIEPDLSSEERESSLFDQLVERGVPHELAAQVAHDAKASMDDIVSLNVANGVVTGVTVTNAGPGYKSSPDYDPTETLRRLAIRTRRTLRALIVLMGICFVIALADLADIILRHL